MCKKVNSNNRDKNNIYIYVKSSIPLTNKITMTTNMQEFNEYARNTKTLNCDYYGCKF